MSRRSLSIPFLALLVVGTGGLPAVAQDETVVRVGITLPLSGSGLASSGPIREAVELMLAAADIPGVRLEPVVLDHTVNGVHDPVKGEADIVTLIGDPSVLAVVGPFNSDRKSTRLNSSH